jgi:hypothetical protein
MGNYTKSTTVEIDDTIDQFKYNGTSGKLEGSVIIEGKAFDIAQEAQAYLAGRVSYDPDSLTVLADTGITGVRVNVGQEEHYLVCNNSGAQIDNGKAVYASGVDGVNNCIEIDLADASGFFTSAQVLGLATHNIPDGTVGLVTTRGVVRDFDTSALSVSGLVWLGIAGDLTQTKPVYPNQRVAIGTVLKSDAVNGQALVVINNISRNDIDKSYSFTSQGIPAGLYQKAGFYDFNDASFSFSNATPSVLYGTVGRARDAHAGIVASGAGVVVGGGQVGLRVTGTRDSEDGTPQQAGYIATITEDITTLTADTYFETTEKFSGQLNFELYVVSGTPTSYSLEANYGFAKYDDMQDRDYTITGFECVWQGNQNNNTLDIALIKHTASGWTFASSGFIPGNGDICRKSVDMAIDANIDNGLDGAYKRVNLDVLILGSSGEGHVIEIVTGGTSTVQSMDLHVKAVSEELDF